MRATVSLGNRASCLVCALCLPLLSVTAVCHCCLSLLPITAVYHCCLPVLRGGTPFVHHAQHEGGDQKPWGGDCRISATCYYFLSKLRCALWNATFHAPLSSLRLFLSVSDSFSTRTATAFSHQSTRRLQLHTSTRSWRTRTLPTSTVRLGPIRKEVSLVVSRGLSSSTGKLGHPRASNASCATLRQPQDEYWTQLELFQAWARSRLRLGSFPPRSSAKLDHSAAQIDIAHLYRLTHWQLLRLSSPHLCDSVSWVRTPLW